MTQNGIDVSSWQGAVDWRRVRQNGVEFAILRAGYGWENPEKQTDAQFLRNYDGAGEAGVPVGCYLYSYARTRDEARREAEFLMALAAGKRFAYPLFYDLEDASQRDLSRAQLTDVAEAFCRELEENGWFPGLYCNLDWARNRLDMARLAAYDLWLAQYRYAPTYTGPFTLWQYTSTGRVDGIAGNVDLDVCYKDYPALMAAQGKNGFPQPQPEHGSLLLDTKEYTLPPGGVYDVKAVLQGADPARMKVYFSRTGIASVQKLTAEKFRVTGLAEGVTYLMFEVYGASGRQLNHASVKFTVRRGASPAGVPNSAPSIF